MSSATLLLAAMDVSDITDANSINEPNTLESLSLFSSYDLSIADDFENSIIVMQIIEKISPTLNTFLDV